MKKKRNVKIKCRTVTLLDCNSQNILLKMGDHLKKNPSLTFM